MERRRVAKSEKQYLRGIIHNLSLQKWTDQDIVDYLRDEKSIDMGRSTVTKIKNQIEREAEKWYIELRESRYKFIATYKERLDSLLSYQKKLNEILTCTKKEETKIRAIATLQSIELDIFNIYKQLPEIRIEEINNNDNQTDKVEDNPQLVPGPGLDQVWGSEPTPSVDDAVPIDITTSSSSSSPNTSSTSTSTSTNKEEKQKEDDYVWKL